MPFEAAKAVAARLCYKIRYVLVPVFGPDFVAMCVDKHNPDFGNLSIERGIIRQCTEDAAAIQAQSRESSSAASPRAPAAYAEIEIWPPKPLHPNRARVTDVESGYGSDTDRSAMYSTHPGSPASTAWTPVNTPRVTNLDSFHFPPAPRQVTSSPWVQAFPPSSPKARPSKRRRACKDEASEDELPCTSSSSASESEPTSPKRRKVASKPSRQTVPMATDVEAALTLMQLCKAGITSDERAEKSRRRRASA